MLGCRAQEEQDLLRKEQACATQTLHAQETALMHEAEARRAQAQEIAGAEFPVSLEGLTHAERVAEVNREQQHGKLLADACLFDSRALELSHLHHGFVELINFMNSSSSGIDAHAVLDALNPDVEDDDLDLTGGAGVDGYESGDDEQQWSSDADDGGVF